MSLTGIILGQEITKKTEECAWCHHNSLTRAPNLNAKMFLLTSIFTSFHSMSQKEKEESASPVQFNPPPGLTTRREHSRLLIEEAKCIAAQ
jgi:hypothetical protein